jgi:hypothetical protein
VTFESVRLSVPDKDTLRRVQSIARVANALGVPLDAYGRGRCPFHDDSNPSFNVWVDPYGVERWGCFPCGLSGDVFDFVARIRGGSFADSLRYVFEVVSKMPAIPTKIEREEFNERVASGYVRDAMTRADQPENRGLLCIACGLATEDTAFEERNAIDFMLRGLNWGTDASFNTVIPHYAPGGEMTGVKVRSIDGAKWSFSGSKYPHLYGAWRPRASDTLILCEGETDFGYTLFTAGAHADVWSVPSGAGTIRPEWAETVGAYEHVIIAFDNDDAGNLASSKWTVMLRRHDPNTRLSRFLPPHDQDLRSSKPTVDDMYSKAVQL